MSGADKKQWEKFKALPNLIYTDAGEWALYRSGELQGQVFKFSGDIIAGGASAIDDEDAAELHTLLLDFLNWQPKYRIRRLLIFRGVTLIQLGT